MGLSIDQCVDLTVATLNKMEKGKWTELATSLQDYELFKMIRERPEPVTGKGYQFQVRTATAGTARNVGLYQQNAPNVADGLHIGRVTLCHTEASWSYDILEDMVNSGPEEFVNLIQTRRTGAWIDIAARMNADALGIPSSTSDATTPWGLRYWLGYNATAGFNGGDIGSFTGSSARAGLSSSTYSAWKNYTFNYSANTKPDLVTKMRKAYRMCDFQPPVSIPEIAGKSNWAIYSAYDTEAAVEALVEDQNENLGNDLASKDGQTLFRGVPWKSLRQLDSYTTSYPVIGMNWGSWKIITLSGNTFREDKPSQSPTQHNVVNAWVNTSWNLACVNLRLNFLGAKADWSSGV
jgi:hypothetical protein